MKTPVAHFGSLLMAETFMPAGMDFCLDLPCGRVADCMKFVDSGRIGVLATHERDDEMFVDWFQHPCRVVGAIA